MMILTENKQDATTLLDCDWETLYWDYQPRITNFFYYRFSDFELAQDLTSITFTKAWRARHQYQDERGLFAAWLFTIARNVAYDYLRGMQRNKEVPIEPFTHIPAEHSVEQEAQKHRDAAYLNNLLKTLSSREQEIIAFKFKAGMTNRAISRHVGLSESNVGTIIHRAIKKLRRTVLFNEVS